jgi:hypothetical protein
MDAVTTLLSKMDERLARQDEILSQLAAVLAEVYRTEAETKQLVAQAARMHAEHSLSFERLMQASRDLATLVAKPR